MGELAILSLPVLVFGIGIGGAALTAAAWLRGFAPAERLALGAGAALVGLYLAGLAIHLTGAGWAWLALWPAATAALAWPARGELRALLAAPAVPAILAGWAWLAAWLLGLQALVFAYSGGTWAVDWYEHYERALFFQQHWPADHAFVAGYSLPARPPLANVVAAAGLAAAGHGFAEYQILATLLASLVFLPLAALTQAAGPDRPALRRLGLLLMLSPLVVQNATFPWTKLPAAFFVLLAVVLLTGPAATARRFAATAVALSAGLLTHYSVAPWILALGAGWLAAGAHPRPAPSGRPTLAGGVLAAGVLAATWFGWAAWQYGPAALATATSTVGHAPEVDSGRRVAIAAANLGRSVLPDLASPQGELLLRQAEPLGRLRDVAFLFYQVNLVTAFGLGNLCALGWLVARPAAAAARVRWAVTIAVAVVLGLAAHTRFDPLGLAHIALQPLFLLGLAWVAIRAGDFPRWLRRLWWAGLAADLALGIALHFGLQSLALLRWRHPGMPSWELVRGLSEIAVANFENKYRAQQPFLADLAGGARPAVAAALVLLLAGAVWRARRAAPRAAPGPEITRF